MIFLRESSLRRAIAEFVEHNHLERPHQGLPHRTGRRVTADVDDGDPRPRAGWRPPEALQGRSLTTGHYGYFVLYFGCTRELIPGVWRPTRARPGERPRGGSRGPRAVGLCTNAMGQLRVADQGRREAARARPEVGGDLAKDAFGTPSDAAAPEHLCTTHPEILVGAIEDRGNEPLNSR